MQRSLIAMALLMLAPLANAQIYKWTDAGGTVHYSEAPPAQGMKYKEVKPSGSIAPVAAPAATSKEMESSAEPREKDAQAASAVADTPENRGKLCTSLKSNLAALKGNGPVVMQQDGKPTALDGAQRTAQTSTAQTQYDQYCQTTK